MEGTIEKRSQRQSEIMARLRGGRTLSVTALATDLGVAVRSVKSVALGAQEAALLDGPALASAPGGLSSKLRALRRIMSGSNRAAVPLSALLCRDRPARLDRSVTGAASTLRQLQFLNQAAVTGASHSDCLRK